MFLVNAWNISKRATVPKLNDEEVINVGILGAAKIAPNACIAPLSHLPNARAYAVAARDKVRAVAFAKKYDIPVVHDSYEALILDPNVHAVFNPLPHGLHCMWTLKAIDAGKHVLCEKPITNQEKEVDAIIARLHERTFQSDVPRLVVVEAFHWRTHPLANEFLIKVLKGELPRFNLGRIRSVDASFLLPSFMIPDSDIRFDYNLGGGALMDLGCYAVSAVRHVITHGVPDEAQEPVVKTAIATPFVKDSRVDAAMESEIIFQPSGIAARICCNFRSGYFSFENKLAIKGENGELTITLFIAPSVAPGIRFVRNDGSTERMSLLAESNYKDCHMSSYYHQMRAFIECVQIARRRAHFDDIMRRTGLPTLEESKAHMALIDAIYEKSGIGKRPIIV